MPRSATFQSRNFGRDPAEFYERHEGESAKKRRQREEALADIASIYRRPPAPKPAPRPVHKPLEEFLAEEDGPKQRSEAWKRADALFKRD
jgi:hypothetical protein